MLGSGLLEDLIMHDGAFYYERIFCLYYIIVVPFTPIHITLLPHVYLPPLSPTFNYPSLPNISLPFSPPPIN